MKKQILRVLALSLALTLLLTSSGLALTLRYPERGASVLRMQTALQQLGYYSSSLDGVYGKGTRDSVRAFQKAYGLSVDGVAGPKTISKLESLTGIDIDGSNGTSSGGSSGEEDLPATKDGLFAGVYSTIQYGAKGDRVRILQRALLALGFEVSAVDGDFGSSTYKAVKAFQEAVGLTVDGKAGKKTLQKLETYFDEEGNCISGPLVKPDAPTPDENLEYDVPTRTLRVGMSGLDVQYTQQRLYTLGYYTGARDGQFGSGMLKAVKAFQTKNGLDADGVIGSGTRKVLFSTGAIGADEEIEEPETHRTLRLGMEGEDVAALQLRLKELGYYTGTADGVYGTGTVNAVKAFQARNSLTVDGVCGENTAEKIYSSNAIDAGSSVATPTPTIPSTQPTETLQYGDKGDEVKSLQKRLSELGYYTGTIDGVFGTGTYNAVKFFQARNSLTVDGKAGIRTLELLFSDDAINAEDGTTEEVTPTPTPMATPSRTLRLGYTGDDVKLLQSRLIDLGYLKATASGIFDNKTLTALKAFQLANGLTVDGVAGTKTYKKLFSDVAIEATPAPDSDDSGDSSGSTSAIPDRALTNGDTGEDVKSVQQRLKELGYLSGSADGVYGDATTAAMKAFQQMNSLTATGNGNMATYARLFSDDAITAEGVKDGESTPTYTNLTFGSKGAAVIRLQQKLAELKYTVTVTGAFDEQTYAAVLAFQRRNFLTPDGIAGVKTQTKLYSGDCATGDTSIPEEDGSLEGLTGNGGGPSSTSEVKWLMWYDDVKPNLKNGQVILVYEPTTNTSYYVWVYARGKHLDCEPYTSQDAAILRAIWGGNSWDEKPVYVRLPNGTWCLASTFSMPHEENPIKDNDFDGHVCIHFPRTMEETITAGDTKNGVRHQNDIRKHWLALTGENITW